MQVLESVDVQHVTLLLREISREFRSVGTYRVLAQNAYSLGRHLSLISEDPDVVRLATDEGIPVYRSAAAYRDSLQALPVPGHGSQSSSRRLRPRLISPAVIGGLAFLVGFGLLILYLWLPVVTVVLTPTSQLVTGEMDVRVDTNSSVVDTVRGRIPARSSRFVIELSEPNLTAGRVADNGARAQGIVLLSNRLGGDPISVPAGTVVATVSGAKYATESDARIDGEMGARTRVPITAMMPGENGNVGRLEISRVYGALGSRVAVLNEEPTTGGGQSLTPVITVADHERARTTAQQRARTDGIRRIRDEAKTSETVLPTTFAFTTITESFDHDVGSRASAFSYRLKAEATALVISNAHVREVVKALWHPILPQNSFAPDAQLQIMSPTVISQVGSVVQLRVAIQTLAVQTIDTQKVKDRVSWRPADEARRDLSRTFKLSAEPRVTLQPRWAERAMRVNLVLDLNEPTPVSSPSTLGG